MSYWWLEGQAPVAQPLAQARANICMACPMNESATGLDKLSVAVARRVRAALAKKHTMNLTLEEEDRLGLCAACGCHLQLKPWTPGVVIFKDGRPDYFDDLAPTCWVRVTEDSPR